MLPGCGGPDEYAIVGTARAAGADGLIQVEEIEGGNRLVTVELDHLPPPARLGEGMRAYVVWFVGNGQTPVKAGQLDYEEDARRGSMSATTPLSSFEVRVTAETNPNAASPSDVVVADRRVSEEE